LRIEEKLPSFNPQLTRRRIFHTTLLLYRFFYEPGRITMKKTLGLALTFVLCLCSLAFGQNGNGNMTNGNMTNGNMSNGNMSNGNMRRRTRRRRGATHGRGKKTGIRRSTNTNGNGNTGGNTNGNMNR
jgi:hypothetical protein